MDTPTLESQPSLVDPRIDAPTFEASAIAASPPAQQQIAILQRGLVAGAAFYFVMFVGIASFFSFINVYFASLGYTGAQMGLIGMAGTLATIITLPLWSAFADRWQIHKKLLIGVSFVLGLVSLLFLGVSVFGVVLFLSVLTSIFRSPIPVMLDSSVVSTTQRTGAKYSRIRVWGSLGFGIGALLAGWLAGIWGTQVIFWVQFLCFSVAAVALGTLLPFERSTNEAAYGGALRTLLKSPQYRGLFVFMLGYGAAGGAHLSFGGLYMLSLGAAASLVGLTFAAGTFIEIPAMLSGDRISRRFGLKGTLLIAGFGLAALYLIASLARDPWQLLVALACTGIFSGIAWSAVAPYSIASAQPEVRASAIGIVMTAFTGLGPAIGILLSGFIWDAYGGSGVYLFAAISFALGSSFFLWSAREKA